MIILFHPPSLFFIHYPFSFVHWWDLASVFQELVTPNSVVSQAWKTAVFRNSVHLPFLARRMMTFWFLEADSSIFQCKGTIIQPQPLGKEGSQTLEGSTEPVV